MNYLATALLSILMLPYLIRSSSAGSLSRLVFVSSLGHYFGSRKLYGVEEWSSILGTINEENFCNR